MPDLYLDLTELLNFPIRSGIQRVEGELLRWWPEDVPFRIATFDPCRGMVVMPDGAAGCLRHLFTATGTERDQWTAELQRVMSSPAARALDPSDEGIRLVVPEVFYERQRISYYSGMTDGQRKRTFFLVFDLLPLTHPACFGPTAYPEIMGAYFRLLRMATQVGFISKATRTVFYERLRRSPEVYGPAFYLGSDGLGPRPRPAPPRPFPVFSVVGTIEPRKNHAAVFEAFRVFQKERPDAQLRFYGNLGWHVSGLGDTISSENGKNGFRFVENPSDAVIREGIIESTATIYASAGEGFGLPPVESLWLGTPVIASRHIPSLENLAGQGLVYLDSIGKDALLAAMRTVSQEVTSETLREQSHRLDLPTWKSFASGFSQWVQG